MLDRSIRQSLIKWDKPGSWLANPFHWHIAGDVPGQFIDNSSIHDSFQRCVTIHATNQASVRSNVCYRFKGHGFFLENGSETKNYITGNMAMSSLAPTRTKILLASDDVYSGDAVTGNNAMRFPPVANFWITNPDNYILSNVAIGGVGTGFWMSFDPEIREYNPNSGHFDGAVIATPSTTPLLSWSNNVASSMQVGQVFDGVKSTTYLNNPNNANDMKMTTSYYSPAIPPTISGLVAFKNRITGMYYRGPTAIFVNNVYADNFISFFVAKHEILLNSIIVGRSANDNPTLDLPHSMRSGAVLYDGPFELQNVGFFKFDTTKHVYGTLDTTATPFTLVAGANRYTNITKNLQFTPEPLYRIYDKPDPYTVQIDYHISTKIRDYDGTLTGTAGATLMPNLVAAPSCAIGAKFSGYKVCPPSIDDTILWMQTSATEEYVPFVVRRSDGALSIAKEHWNLVKDVEHDTIGGGDNRKVRLINSGFDYTIETTPMPNLYFHVSAEHHNVMSPLINFKGAGNNCTVVATDNTPIVHATSVDALRASTQTAYYASGNNLYVRLSSTLPFLMIQPTSMGLSTESVGAHTYFLNCTSGLTNDVTGTIDGVSIVGANTVVHGWACQTSRTNNIAVQIYANAGRGQPGAVYLGSTTANQVSEATVNFACANLNEYQYRYSYTLPNSQVPHGKRVFANGISQTATPDNLLVHSGTFLFP